MDFAGRTGNLGRYYDAELVEAFVDVETVKFTRQLWYENVIFEGVCVQVIQKINNVIKNFSDVSNLIKEVKDLKKNMAYAEFDFI